MTKPEDSAAMRHFIDKLEITENPAKFLSSKVNADGQS